MIVAMMTAVVTGAITMPTIVGAMKTMAAVIVAAMTTNELVSRVDAPREGEGDHRTEQACVKSGAERFHGGRELLQGPCCCARDERRRSWITELRGDAQHATCLSAQACAKRVRGTSV